MRTYHQFYIIVILLDLATISISQVVHLNDGRTLVGYTDDYFSDQGSVYDFLRVKNGLQSPNVEFYKNVSFSDVEIWRGVKYGTAERFQRPKVWSNHLDEDHKETDCTKAGPVCPQSLNGFLNPYLFSKKWGSSWKNDQMSEDCLSLDVYRPKNTDDNKFLPVLVWIHGGGYTVESIGI